MEDSLFPSREETRAAPMAPPFALPLELAQLTSIPIHYPMEGRSFGLGPSLPLSQIPVVDITAYRTLKLDSSGW